MQPYFMPYIGYLNLAFNVDQWVFFDIPQFNKKSWMNRNKILHPDPEKSFSYINIPIEKAEKGTPIQDIKINYSIDWADTLVRQLDHYRRMRAPNFDAVIDLIYEIYKNNANDFTHLIEKQMKNISKYLDVPFKSMRSSEIDFDRSSILGSGDWALEISKHLGARHYINPIGGVSIFDEKKFLANDMKISFLKPTLSPYKQSHRKFTPGLSIIDQLMFLDPLDIKDRIENDYTLLSSTEVTLI